MIRGAPLSVHGWKDRFFFVLDLSVEEWIFPHWGRPRDSVFQIPKLGDEDLERSAILRGCKIFIKGVVIGASSLQCWHQFGRSQR